MNTPNPSAAATPNGSDKSPRLKPGQLADETTIVWLEDVAAIPYVREVWMHTGRRAGPFSFGATLRSTPALVAAHKRRIVGYAELCKDAPRDRGSYGLAYGFQRRLFYLDGHDRANAPDGVYRVGCPIEAVDPATVAAGSPGYATDRAQGNLSVFAAFPLLRRALWSDGPPRRLPFARRLMRGAARQLARAGWYGRN